MKFEDWINERTNNRPEEPTEKNSDGGFDPEPEQVAKFKKADLITLTVPGTNCFNCMYARKKNEDAAYCVNEGIQAWVTKHMCCAYWDRKDIERVWKS